MAPATTTVQIRSRGKPIRNLPKDSTFTATEPTRALFNDLAKRAHTSPHRLGITKVADGSKIVYSLTEPLATYNLTNGTELYVKDLGPQIGWRSVYVIEYAGPLVIHPLIYLARPYIWRGCDAPSLAQTTSMILITLHFLKRVLETVFIHRFSNATMPFFNVFRNSAHYWIIAGLLIAFTTYRPGAPTETNLPDPILYSLIGLYAVAEFLNANAHYTLSQLRRPGTQDRGIPHGIGFGAVTCPNYMFEELAWLTIWLVNRSWSTLVLMGFGTYYMGQWARKKERRYRKEFPETYKKKKFTMLPGLL